ncbi:MAG TPA: transcription termination factor NusA [Thermoleophilia bacterium]|nr:transcription termination factor NusA [Thermoleophilia bacterium]HQG03193.1 transcription termination factor NusA [Thermoleophilia bacterium]
MSREIIEALRQIEKEKGIAFDALVEALEDALLSAYKKTPDAVEHAKVEVDTETGEMRVFQLIFPDHIDVESLKVYDEPAEGTLSGAEAPRDNWRLDLSGVDMSEVERVEVTPENFGRIAAQTAKQVILQRIREAERDLMFEEYVDRVGDLVTGVVQQSDARYTLVELGRVEALLPKSEQIETEHYDHGSRIKAVIVKVQDSSKGPQVILSRRSDQLVRKLFELEVPEIADGLVEIKYVARETGSRGRDGKPMPGRCKIAVVSHADGVDPVGACVGPRGSRVRMVVSELRGERIDIVPYHDDPARFVAKALSPARVREVIVDDEKEEATVIVPDDQLSLAIGKEGQNARLASKLTGWRIDIKSQQQMAAAEAELDFGDDELAGQCMAITRNGKRCVNASEPGSKYCSIHADYVPSEAEKAAQAAAEAARSRPAQGGEGEDEPVGAAGEAAE